MKFYNNKKALNAIICHQIHENFPKTAKAKKSLSTAQSKSSQQKPFTKFRFYCHADK